MKRLIRSPIATHTPLEAGYSVSSRSSSKVRKRATGYSPVSEFRGKARSPLPGIAPSEEPTLGVILADPSGQCTERRRPWTKSMRRKPPATSPPDPLSADRRIKHEGSWRRGGGGDGGRGEQSSPLPPWIPSPPPAPMPRWRVLAAAG